MIYDEQELLLVRLLCGDLKLIVHNVMFRYSESLARARAKFTYYYYVFFFLAIRRTIFKSL